MIPIPAINAWRQFAPWQNDEQVEQDLIMTRALIEIFTNETLKDELAFRGGTALNKLYLPRMTRYSEDLDMVQTQAKPIGETIDRIRYILDPWLGEPRRKRNEGRVVLIYRFNSENITPVPLRLKIEINTREHQAYLGFIQKEIAVKNVWFNGTAKIKCFHLEELLATKLRALYQRKKGRDLYDLFVVSRIYPDLDWLKLFNCFQKYMAVEGHVVTRAQFEQNLSMKCGDVAFVNDIFSLLHEAGSYRYQFSLAQSFVFETIAPLFPGEPWQGDS